MPMALYCSQCGDPVSPREEYNFYSSNTLMIHIRAHEGEYAECQTCMNLTASNPKVGCEACWPNIYYEHEDAAQTDPLAAAHARQSNDFRQALGAIPLEPGMPTATEAIRKARDES